MIGDRNFNREDVIIRRGYNSFGFEFGLCRQHDDGSSSTLSFAWEKYTHGHTIAPNCLLELSHDNVQVLMDQLWGLGIRPTYHVNEQAKSEAMQHHIDSLREVLRVALPSALVQPAPGVVLSFAPKTPRPTL